MFSSLMNPVMRTSNSTALMPDLSLQISPPISVSDCGGGKEKEVVGFFDGLITRPRNSLHSSDHGSSTTTDSGSSGSDLSHENNGFFSSSDQPQPPPQPTLSLGAGSFPSMETNERTSITNRDGSALTYSHDLNANDSKAAGHKAALHVSDISVMKERTTLDSSSLSASSDHHHKLLDLEFTLGRPSWQMDYHADHHQSSNELTLLKC
ncbi:hypothetical protein EZV62_021489 [Acer yangbiense]|uniref:Uncharacterized protein n=1 Tax=Acer yangbiense TaxID=1000413 RepID=A0A5C7H5S7_9ROSI|nr:hypothetical protein EZV62_021489 [Acer yangbiense]